MGSIPARISFHPMVARSYFFNMDFWCARASNELTLVALPCCAVYTTRPPLHSYHSGTKPRARYEWSGGLFLRYVCPLPTWLAYSESGWEGAFVALCA